MKNARLDELYRRYRHAIHTRCRWLLGHEQAAEDATQEVFCRVARHFDKVPTSEEALRWLYRITRNYCLNELRNAKRRPCEALESMDIPDAQREAQLVDRDLARRLIRRAPAHVGVAAWLYHVDGMSHDEVGGALGVCRRTAINYIAEFDERALRFIGRQR